MKKFTLIVIFLAFAAIAVKSSDLRIRLHNHSSFFVELNHQLYGQYASQHNLMNIAPGNHYLKVYTYGHSRRGYHNYNSYRILFQGYINIPYGVSLNTMINHYGQFVVLNSSPIRNNTYRNPRNGYHNRNHHPRNRYHTNSYSTVMSAPDFQNFKATIINTSFESTRYDIARSALHRHLFTTNQVIEILYLFSFESTKLDFAKLAYHKTIDQDRYYLVNNAFTFESSIRALNRYIYGY